MSDTDDKAPAGHWRAETATVTRWGQKPKVLFTWVDDKPASPPSEEAPWVVNPSSPPPPTGPACAPVSA